MPKPLGDQIGVMIRQEVVVVGEEERRREATRGNKAVASPPESTH